MVHINFCYFYPKENKWITHFNKQTLTYAPMLTKLFLKPKHKHKPTIVFKVDYEKAYDSIMWDFLIYMLQRMNFCDKWVRWIRGCLESNFVSVIVNGSPTSEFKMWKGLIQGDLI